MRIVGGLGSKVAKYKAMNLVAMFRGPEYRNCQIREVAQGPLDEI